MATHSNPRKRTRHHIMTQSISLRQRLVAIISPVSCPLSIFIQLSSFPSFFFFFLFHVLSRRGIGTGGRSATHSNSSPGTASGLPCVCTDIFSAGCCRRAAGRGAGLATLIVLAGSTVCMYYARGTCGSWSESEWLGIGAR